MEVHVPTLEQTLKTHVETMQAPERLKEAMLYSLDAGGKRIRPLLLIATAGSYKPVTTAAYQLGATVEMVHTYSLIHDDLPSMDNDDTRRGKPTNHKVFGEALAILAGDALLTESFSLIGNMSEETLPPRDALYLSRRLTEASGATGMVGGQVADLEAENRTVTLEELEWIHRQKTAALLTFAVEAGGVLGEAPREDITRLRHFAEEVGIAFQIKDDLLDVEGSESTIGKPVGSDEHNHKSTYPGLLSVDEAKRKLHTHIERAEHALQSLTVPAPDLFAVLSYMESRDR
ncbi:geranylgeranyl diphosphate synthase, type II [Natribacillus halophilus]|uniref:Farnesyl diphosphate synthase n=2 Tax=Natribacillus halophilus TaxID=549003 RepID=A0A1G8JJM9_9BACI|nr:geranylgeranyl diphosphate synthase, type II [Natribacillus halophilus]